MNQYKDTTEPTNTPQRFKKWLIDDFLAFAFLMGFTVWLISCSPAHG